MIGGIDLSDLKSLNKKEQWKQRAKSIKSDVLALYLSYKDPRVSLHAKLFIILVVGYALSPIDLIPDFIPVLGYLDDILLIPIGVVIAIKMIPPKVMDEARIKAKTLKLKPKNWIAASIIVIIWIVGIILVLLWLINSFKP